LGGIQLVRVRIRARVRVRMMVRVRVRVRLALGNCKPLIENLSSLKEYSGSVQCG